MNSFQFCKKGSDSAKMRGVTKDEKDPDPECSVCSGHEGTAIGRAASFLEAMELSYCLECSAKFAEPLWLVFNVIEANNGIMGCDIDFLESLVSYDLSLKKYIEWHDIRSRYPSYRSRRVDSAISELSNPDLLTMGEGDFRDWCIGTLPYLKTDPSPEKIFVIAKSKLAQYNNIKKKKKGQEAFSGEIKGLVSLWESVVEKNGIYEQLPRKSQIEVMVALYREG